MSEPVEVVVARIGRPHGLRGEMTVRLSTDEPDRRFTPGSRLVLGGSGRVLTVDSWRRASGSVLLRFTEVGDRTAAEAIQGEELSARVDADERPEAPEEYYDRQLRGLQARDSRGQPLGRVTAVIHMPAQDLLAIDVDGTERLVPFVAELVPQVDLAAGTLTVADVGGLVDDDAEEAR
ncbi:Ribosome maturation factor RimM [Acidipropionibacterium virtanenii]|uniref:Ribosome maturation factor RimM n=2 Tax=Acidipropionibacterium virtanenii TaxID=2057246 RepID=A0A344UTC3_9ACTN|nr:Ribosome maturation factor RimM [Acidipropionibacterium virtanenii]